MINDDIGDDGDGIGDGSDDEQIASWLIWCIRWTW